MIYVLCGLPGSGKTSLSKKLSQQYNAVICSYDNFVKKYKSRDYSLFYSLIHEEAEKNNIIIDNLHITLKQRKEILNLLKDINEKKILIILSTPLEECIERNRQRKECIFDSIIYHLNAKYELPTLAEGWDEIITI